MDSDEQSSLSKKINWAAVIVKPILCISFIPLIVTVLDIMSKEKQEKLVDALRRMGLIDSALWISFAVPMILISVLTSALSAAFAKLVPGSVNSFQNTSFLIIFIVNFLYSLSLVGFAFFWSSFLSRPVFVNALIGIYSAATVIVSLVLFLSFVIQNKIPVFHIIKKFY
jgi:hypothetical protein